MIEQYNHKVKLVNETQPNISGRTKLMSAKKPKQSIGIPKIIAFDLAQKNQTNRTNSSTIVEENKSGLRPMSLRTIGMRDNLIQELHSKKESTKKLSFGGIKQLHDPSITLSNGPMSMNTAGYISHVPMPSATSYQAAAAISPTPYDLSTSNHMNQYVLSNQAQQFGKDSSLIRR